MSRVGSSADEQQQLRADLVGDRVVDRLAEEDDPLAQQPVVDRVVERHAGARAPHLEDRAAAGGRSDSRQRTFLRRLCVRDRLDTNEADGAAKSRSGAAFAQGVTATRVGDRSSPVVVASAVAASVGDRVGRQRRQVDRVARRVGDRRRARARSASALLRRTSATSVGRLPRLHDLVGELLRRHAVARGLADEVLGQLGVADLHLGRRRRSRRGRTGRAPTSRRSRAARR